MTISYRPFDSGAGANVTEDGWRAMASHWLPTGVLRAVENEFAVSERGLGATMSVDVAAGEAWIRGHHVDSDAVENLPISAADLTDDRIDRIVLRADFVANTITLEVLEGTPDPAPTVPALTQSAARWEIPLARVLVGNGVSSILDANITDERPGAAPYHRSASMLDVVNLATETALYSKVIAPGDMGVGKALRLVLAGDYFNNSGSDRTFTFRVKLGSTVLFGDVSPTIPVSGTRRPWNVDLLLGNHAADEQHLHGNMRMGSPLAGSAGGLGDLAAASHTIDGTFSAHPAVDTSVAQTLEVTIQHSAASANLSMRRMYALLELV